MPSKQVIKLCEKIQKDCGIVCIPESFNVIRSNLSFYVWYMYVDIDKSTGFSKNALELIGDCTICMSTYYMKELLEAKKITSYVDLDCSEVIVVRDDYD